MHILVTRPETQASRTKCKLEAMGHRVTTAPILGIRFETPPLMTSGIQAIVLTSRNAVSALASHPQKASLMHLPVLAVGESTAEAARKAGFDVALTGDAGGAELAGLIAGKIDPRAGALLHISGESIAFDLEKALAPAGFTISRAILYQSIPAEQLPREVEEQLKRGKLDAVILMSPRTAKTWCDLTIAAGLGSEAASLMHICLSRGVAAAAAELAPACIKIAVKPNEEEMLALVAGLPSSSRHII